MGGLTFPGWAKSAAKMLPIVATLAVASVLAYHRPPQPPMDPLLGVWTTNNPAYAGRQLEIHKDHIVITFGDDSVYTEAISGVEVEPRNGRLVYTIHTISYDTTYKPQDEHPAMWRFEYNPANGGTLRVAHQPDVVWEKTAPGR